MALLTGCGETDPNGPNDKTVTVRETVTQATQEPKPDAQPSRSKLHPASAVQVVQRFYGLLSQYRYPAAWPLLPAAVQAAQGSYSAWREGYRSNISTTVTDAHVVAATSSTARVAVSLRAKDADPCSGSVTQTFAGTWTFTAEDRAWVANDIAMDRTSGRPPRSASQCAPPDPPESPDPPPNYNYGGGDLDCDDVGDTNFPVGPGDPNGFDADGDGIGCES